MPGFTWPEELEESKAKAVYLAGQGGRWNRLRAWFIRLGMTQVGDVFRGKVWPNGRTPYDH